MFYSFQNRKSKKVTTKEMKLSELDDFLKNNPHLEQIIVNSTPQVSPYSVGRLKTDSAFRDRMNSIKKNHHGAKIQTGNINEI